MQYPVQVIQGKVPSKSNCYEIIAFRGHGSLKKTDALKKYEESFLWQVGSYRDLNISEPFEFFVDVYFQSKKTDLDNSFKIVLDCLQRAKAINNDNNCCKIVARKFICKDNPHIEFFIRTLD